MSVETKFEKQGSINPPKVIGRLTRLGLSGVLLVSIYSLVTNWSFLINNGLNYTAFETLAGLAIAFIVFPYVVNIGLGLNLKLIPQYAIAAVLLGLGAYNQFTIGNFESPLFNGVVGGWLIYTFGHLGVSFLLAAILATPGCEMRAIPHLWTKLTGRETREHYCPGFLDNIDKWEAKRK